MYCLYFLLKVRLEQIRDNIIIRYFHFDKTHLLVQGAPLKIIYYLLKFCISLCLLGCGWVGVGR